MSVLFVAGTGTDIGKTYVTARLIDRLRADKRPLQALKPVASGVPEIDAPAFAQSDTAVLLTAMGLPITKQTVGACTPWRFSAPLSPDMAAAAEGRTLRLSQVLSWCRTQVAAAGADTTTLVEGVGGLMSPMTEDALNLDLIEALGCPTMLVCGTYLGALSHTLSALEVMRRRGIKIHALVVNETAESVVEYDKTVAAMRRFSDDSLDILLLRSNDRDIGYPSNSY